jgi:hypothetical protein
MFALLAAAQHTISFGETYAVSDDPANLKTATSPCYGQPHDTHSSCTTFSPVLDNVGGSMVFSKTEQQVVSPKALTFVLTPDLLTLCYCYHFSKNYEILF